MRPAKIGACLPVAAVADHREWLFEAERDLEIQDFMAHASLTSDRAETVARVRAALGLVV
ncbi:MAG: hypothetical protein AAGE03_02455 [Pseudomonadota bacterium]